MRKGIRTAQFRTPAFRGLKADRKGRLSSIERRVLDAGREGKRRGEGGEYQAADFCSKPWVGNKTPL